MPLENVRSNNKTFNATGAKRKTLRRALKQIIKERDLTNAMFEIKTFPKIGSGGERNKNQTQKFSVWKIAGENTN